MQQAKCGSAKTELILNECSNLAWYYCSDLILKNCWVASFIAGGGGAFIIYWMDHNRGKRERFGAGGIKVAGQIEVQDATVTWYPQRPAESPECSSCSSNNEQFVSKRMKKKSVFHL